MESVKVRAAAELVDAVERIEATIDIHEPFDAAYEAHHVCNYILGIEVCEGDEIDEDVAQSAVTFSTEFPKQVESIRVAVQKFFDDDDVVKFAIALRKIRESVAS